MPVISDLLIILILSFTGLFALYVGGGERGVTRVTGPMLRQISSFMQSLKNAGKLSGDPYYRLIFLGLVLLIIGWGKIVAICGAADLVQSIMEPSRPTLFADDCLKNQRDVHKRLSEETSKYSRSFKSGPLYRFEKGMECPNGGRYIIDSRGCLSCEKHGKNDDLPPLKMTGGS
jgi:hypothetical protein